MKFKKEYHSLSKKEQMNIITQFNLEIKYSNILRKTRKHSERGKLYYKLYNKFFEKMHNNPRFHRSEDDINNRLNRKIEFLSKFINKLAAFGNICLDLRLQNFGKLSSLFS